MASNSLCVDVSYGINQDNIVIYSEFVNDGKIGE